MTGSAGGGIPVALLLTCWLTLPVGADAGYPYEHYYFDQLVRTERELNASSRGDVSVLYRVFIGRVVRSPL